MLRSWTPVLLCELIARGVEVKFSYHLLTPLIEWSYGNTGGHQHIDEFVAGFNCSNDIQIQKALSEILSEVKSIPAKDSESV